jgi:hypothetical protein
VIDDLIALDPGVDRREVLERQAGALAKKLMKPSRTPCFFSNRSL